MSARDLEIESPPEVDDQLNSATEGNDNLAQGEVHDRKFNSEGNYPLPVDEVEKTRLDLQHELFTLTFYGQLYLAPITEPRNVLDIGTGTGKWAIDFAEKYPASTVLGTDLSSIQPNNFPPNCSFQIANAEETWSFPSPFDYIHGRALLSCFAEPKKVLASVFEALSPGGYFELQDAVFPLEWIGPRPVDTAIGRFSDLIIDATAKTDRPWTNVPKYAQWMTELGFEDIVERKYYWPLSGWAKGDRYKDIGRLMQENASQMVELLVTRLFVPLLGISAEEASTFSSETKKEFKDTHFHAYTPIRVIYGRKPIALRASVH